MHEYKWEIQKYVDPRLLEPFQQAPVNQEDSGRLIHRVACDLIRPNSIVWTAPYIALSDTRGHYHNTLLQNHKPISVGITQEPEVVDSADLYNASHQELAYIPPLSITKFKGRGVLVGTTSDHARLAEFIWNLRSLKPNTNRIPPRQLCQTYFNFNTPAKTYLRPEDRTPLNIYLTPNEVESSPVIIFGYRPHRELHLIGVAVASQIYDSGIPRIILTRSNFPLETVRAIQRGLDTNRIHLLKGVRTHQGSIARLGPCLDLRNTKTLDTLYECLFQSQNLLRACNTS